MRSLLWTLFLMGWVAACAGGPEGRGHATLAGVPQAAADALRREAGGAALDRIEREPERGVDLYEAAWSAGDGTAHEAKVTADGALVEREESIALAEVPAAARAAIARRFPAGDVQVVRKTWILYEAEGAGGELLVSPTGREVDEGDDEGDDDDDDREEGAP